jgi:hypothetical protein
MALSSEEGAFLKGGLASKKVVRPPGKLVGEKKRDESSGIGQQGVRIRRI